MAIGLIAAGIFVIVVVVGLVCCCYDMQKPKGRPATTTQPTTVPPSTIHIIHHQPRPTLPALPAQGWPQPPVYPHGPPPGYNDGRSYPTLQPPAYPGYCPPDPDTTRNQPVLQSASYGSLQYTHCHSNS